MKVLPSIAWSLLMQGQYQQVLDEIKLDRNSAAIFTMRGYAELALGRLPDAASSFEAALELDPRYDRAILGQASWRWRKGKRTTRTRSSTRSWPRRRGTSKPGF